MHNFHAGNVALRVPFCNSGRTRLKTIVVDAKRWNAMEDGHKCTKCAAIIARRKAEKAARNA